MDKSDSILILDRVYVKKVTRQGESTRIDWFSYNHSDPGQLGSINLKQQVFIHLLFLRS